MSKLTDIAIRKAKPETKPYKMTDGGGMYLLVQPIHLQNDSPLFLTGN